MELTIDQALQRGIAAHRDGRLQDAERFYRSILQAQPTHPHANHNLGLLAVAVEKTDVALPLFKAALEANPKMEQFWLSYIDALIKDNQFDGARKNLADAKQAGIGTDKLQRYEKELQFKLSPHSNILQQDLGNKSQCYQDELSPAIELREAGKYKEAQKWLSDVIENDSKNAEALSLLSQVLMLDKKEMEAERVLTLAASINSELPSIYRNQARLLLKQSKTAEALEKMQSGCQQSPEDPESLVLLANCLVANQRDLEALALIEKILKVKSDHAEAYSVRSLIKSRTKDIVGAIEDAKMTVSIKPHLTQIWQLLGSWHYQNSNLCGAIKALQVAHNSEPNNPAFMIQLGELLRQDNKASEAIIILKKATELAPKDANAWTNFGVALQHEKRIEDAKVAYEMALVLNPKLAAIANNLGAIAQKAEEWESAFQYFGKALEIEPNFAEAHGNLANTLKELGRLDEALASYTQAIALKPDSAEACNNLGVTLYINGDIGSALVNMKKAKNINPEFDTFELINSISQARKSCKTTEVNSYNTICSDYGLKLFTDPLILNRPVERELASVLLQMNSRDLDRTSDARYGNGRCSPDFNLFKENHPVIKTIARDLTSIMKSSVKSDIYIADTFFNILGAGGGSSPHNHLKELDGDFGLFLGRQKYSLVYYLSVGDQNCSEPGTLKLFDPDKDILPCEGMIVIIPASRKHSAIYDGKKDRIMIGANFYGI